MKVIKPTNLGWMTLKNLAKIDDKYRENANLKRKKLAKLWSSEESMSDFLQIFRHYADLAESKIITTTDRECKIKTVSETEIPIPLTIEKNLDEYVKLGLLEIEETSDSVFETLRSINTEQKNNPLQKLRSAYVELTGLCNLKCKHCYRGGSQPTEKGLDVELLKKSLEPLLRAGITSISITGGEATLRREALLEVVEYASQHMALEGIPIKEKLLKKYGKANPTIEDLLETEQSQNLRKTLFKQLTKTKDEICAGDYAIWDKHTEEDVEKMLIHNATWRLKYDKEQSTYDLDSIGILTNGVFENPEELIAELKKYGTGVHMQTSLDSFNGHTTNKHRGKKGVFGKVKRLVEIGKEEEFKIDITAHNIGGYNTRREKENERYFDQNAPMFVTDGFLQLGNSVENEGHENSKNTSKYQPEPKIGDLSSEKNSKKGWCTAWTAPEGIHIKPTGVIGNCLYVRGISEFGNVTEQSMEEILNGIQNTRINEMFRDGTIEKYQHELDKEIFNRKFSRACEIMVLTLTYGAIKERLISEGCEDPIREANKETAKLCGYSVPEINYKKHTTNLETDSDSMLVAVAN
ncbi:radical SAM protein [Candidatus Woesearchaeota archaeon]|jgi:MoaA/NifB/PqqE/SkfB family radical SAM enzyme|nr:radical SAM protein [Candidatus Woesearchaeota archaeon]MBT6518842.1 radical SAM protein [Candidatus Woesearchaeota archaeon]